MGFGSVKPHITNRADTAGAAVYRSRIGSQGDRVAVAGDDHEGRLDCAAVSGDAHEHHLLIDPGVLGQRSRRPAVRRRSFRRWTRRAPVAAPWAGAGTP